MKRFISFVILFLATLALFAPMGVFAADAVKEIVVPDIATNALSALIGKYAAGTVVLSSVTMLIVQSVKKLLALSPSILSGGANGKWIVIAVCALTAIIDACSDGSVTSSDWVSIVQAALGGIGAYFGYKPLFRQPSAPGPVL